MDNLADTHILKVVHFYAQSGISLPSLWRRPFAFGFCLTLWSQEAWYFFTRQLFCDWNCKKILSYSEWTVIHWAGSDIRGPIHHLILKILENNICLFQYMSPENFLSQQPNIPAFVAHSSIDYILGTVSDYVGASLWMSQSGVSGRVLFKVRCPSWAPCSTCGPDPVEYWFIFPFTGNSPNFVSFNRNYGTQEAL